jgi:hypothetical protein
MALAKKYGLSQEYLKELLHYNPNTGEFTWLKSIGGRTKVGKKAGYITSKGYYQTRINGIKCANHRLAFIYMLNKEPDVFVDHIDGNRLNNSWVNLREATYKENAQNLVSHRKNNKLGIIGVHEKAGKFIAQIEIDGKKKFIGTFKTPDEAHNAYLYLKRKHHPFSTI